MIRFVHCVKRNKNLDSGEFRRFWNSAEFQSLLDRMVFITGARRLERDLTLMIQANTMLQQERDSGEPFDGIIELWLDSARDLNAAIDSDEFKELMAEMEEYQSNFIDFHESRRFFTEYNPET